MADKKKTTPSAPASFFGIPDTVMPEYTSGAWANLPTGTWPAPKLTTPTPAPTTPTPAPSTSSNGLLQYTLKGLLGGMNKRTPFSALPADQMAALTQGWGLFGGGATMPTMRDPYQRAFKSYEWPATLPPGFGMQR